MKKFLLNLFNAIDNKDTGRFISFLTEDAVFRFANAPVVKNRENIQESVSQFFSCINGLRHEIKDVWEHGETVICEGEVTYTRRDNSKQVFPFVNIFRMKQGLIRDYRIYTDNSSLFA